MSRLCGMFFKFKDEGYRVRIKTADGIEHTFAANEYDIQRFKNGEDSDTLWVVSTNDNTHIFINILNASSIEFQTEK